METFFAKEYNENSICLTGSEDLQKLYEAINKDENFILEFVRDGKIVSEVIIATNISGKVKTGEIKLVAEAEKVR